MNNYEEFNKHKKDIVLQILKTAAEASDAYPLDMPRGKKDTMSALSQSFYNGAMCALHAIDTTLWGGSDDKGLRTSTPSMVYGLIRGDANTIYKENQKWQSKDMTYPQPQ